MMGKNRIYDEGQASAEISSRRGGKRELTASLVSSLELGGRRPTSALDGEEQHHLRGRSRIHHEEHEAN